jgi:hypothetical protein
MVNAVWLSNFIRAYSQLGTTNIDSLNGVYHPDVEFSDPMHQVSGLDELLDYFHQIYSNVGSCHFVIDHVFESGSEAAIYWTMTFTHKNLNGQRPITVQGHSHLKEQDGLVIFHCDYLDLGAMVYEHVPVLGRVLRSIKQRAGRI